MTNQTCTVMINGEKCGAELTFRRVTRGGLVELYQCTGPYKHNRHISDTGRQYTTHKITDIKTHENIRLNKAQREFIAGLGHTPQSYIDAKLAIDMQG